jgi:FtsP/CotA-like multicopper oxidase with cupredoxin domain
VPRTGAGAEVSLKDVAEIPAVGDTEVWEFFNATADAHPIHIQEIIVQVVKRQAMEEWGTGREKFDFHETNCNTLPERTYNVFWEGVDGDSTGHAG